MTFGEILFYTAVYGLVIVAGGLAAKRVNSKKVPLPALPAANQNYERPQIGSGVGAQIPSSRYVSLSSNRRKAS